MDEERAVGHGPCAGGREEGAVHAAGERNRDMPQRGELACETGKFAVGLAVGASVPLGAGAALGCERFRVHLGLRVFHARPLHEAQDTIPVLESARAVVLGSLEDPHIERTRMS